jgi:hypothetical protein
MHEVKKDKTPPKNPRLGIDQAGEKIKKQMQDKVNKVGNEIGKRK